jgi:hypothetical protein
MQTAVMPPSEWDCEHYPHDPADARFRGIMAELFLELKKARPENSE